MFLQKGNNSMGLKTSLFVTFYIDINSKTKKKHSDYQVFEKGNNSKRFKELIIYYFQFDNC